MVVKIKIILIFIIHSIVPVNLYSSISVSGMSECLSDCAVEVKPIFRNITAVANSTITLIDVREEVYNVACTSVG